MLVHYPLYLGLPLVIIKKDQSVTTLDTRILTSGSVGGDRIIFCFYPYCGGAKDLVEKSMIVNKQILVKLTTSLISFTHPRRSREYQVCDVYNKTENIFKSNITLKQLYSIEYNKIF